MPLSKRTYLIIVILAATIMLVVPMIYVGYQYLASPQVIREPQQEHYHFRIQILIDGKAEDFGSKKYQTGYKKDLCNANLTEQPIHFHDNLDQFNHIHWEGMTGGMVMKYFGWNYIGGIKNALGYKFTSLTNRQRVTIHGNYLPDVPEGAAFYIYTGDENGYKKRSFEDWRDRDLEKFFGKTSNFPAHKLNKSSENASGNFFISRADAHESDDHSTTSEDETEQEKLTRINNLLGNVVIFVQNESPTKAEIEARFNDLEPLRDSTCGG
ncbi:MAG TPA: hypothetical protein PKB15_06500 [Acidimicrobiia bacterium]|nr:hypothetical protein [Acidimicrobiia bacterium]